MFLQGLIGKNEKMEVIWNYLLVDYAALLGEAARWALSVAVLTVFSKRSPYSCHACTVMSIGWLAQSTYRTAGAGVLLYLGTPLGT
jgi:hypothetical protein